MADFHFEEACPCGGSIKLSGYGTSVQPQIVAWRKIHSRHANALAKAKLEDMAKWTYPAYFLPPVYPTPDPPGWWQNPIITNSTETPSAGAEAKD